MKRNDRLQVCAARHVRWLVSVGLMALLLPAFSWAQGNTDPIGQIEYVRGAGLAQAPGQPPRVLGKGLALAEGDRLTTADGATAIVALRDGTRMTVRPNSEMLVQE